MAKDMAEQVWSTAAWHQSLASESKQLNMMLYCQGGASLELSPEGLISQCHFAQESSAVVRPGISLRSVIPLCVDEEGSWKMPKL